MLNINLSEDIRSVTDLKRCTREVLQQAHQTKRPVVLTVNGRADAILLDVEVFQELYEAVMMARLLQPALDDIENGEVQDFREFVAQFKQEKGREKVHDKSNKASKK